MIDVSKLSSEERAAIEARRAYKKRWRENHKEQVKEHQRRFWAKKAAEQQPK